MIAVENLTIHVGKFALEGVGFLVPTGQYGVLMGKTGTGKTTLLEAICGLRRPTGGSIRLEGHDMTRLKPADRGIGYVPQDGVLFSTMTVRDHLAFALRIRRWPADAITPRVEELAARLGIRQLLDRKPKGLSGGESQRVAIGRALSFRPTILCLDEPLSALDDETKMEMYELLRSVQQQEQVTTLHVTHSHDDAEHLADVVLRLSNGKVNDARD